MYIGQSYEMEEIETLKNQYIRTSIPSYIITFVLFALLTVGVMLYIKQLMKRNFSDLKSEFQEQNNMVMKLSHTDGLTGLFNRKYFSEAYDEYIKNHNEYILFVGDANGLKLTNDTFGHEEGDELLKAISRLLEEVFESEYTFRWGGDECFVSEQFGQFSNFS